MVLKCCIDWVKCKLNVDLNGKGDNAESTDLELHIENL